MIRDLLLIAAVVLMIYLAAVVFLLACLVWARQAFKRRWK